MGAKLRLGCCSTGNPHLQAICFVTPSSCRGFIVRTGTQIKRHIVLFSSLCPVFVRLLILPSPVLPDVQSSCGDFISVSSINDAPQMLTCRRKIRFDHLHLAAGASWRRSCQSPATVPAPDFPPFPLVPLGCERVKQTQHS